MMEKKSKKAFDLDVSYYEDISGYEYNNGLLIEIVYESNTRLYKYNGKNIEEIKFFDNVFRINGLDVIDDKAYIKYSDGEESMNNLGMIIELED